MPVAEVSLGGLNASYEEKQSFKNEVSGAAMCPERKFRPLSISQFSQNCMVITWPDIVHWLVAGNFAL